MESNELKNGTFEKELHRIKKKYGDNMMHFCRQNFSTILEVPNLLSKILEDNFDVSTCLLDDIINDEKVDEFKDYIFYLAYPYIHKNIVITDKDPFELMEEAGYNLYKCDNLSDIEKFRKYYVPKELICTFNDDNRIYENDIYFAVKKDVDNIKRDDYDLPDREDKYSTSVLSIQFNKRNHMVSIISRYNDSIKNPNAVYSNDLDKIIPGLTNSFENKYGYKVELLNFYQKFFKISNYVKALNNNKFYKYYYKDDDENIYIGSNNVVIKDNLVNLDYINNKERYIIADNYEIDLSNKSVKNILKNKNDGFSSLFSDVKKIVILRNPEVKDKAIEFIFNDESSRVLLLNENNRILSFKDDYTTEVSDYFLDKCYFIQCIDMPNLVKTGSYFIPFSYNLILANLPNLRFLGDNSFREISGEMSYFSLDNLEETGDYFLNKIIDTKVVNLPSLRVIGNNSFSTIIGDVENINLQSLPNNLDNSFTLIGSKPIINFGEHKKTL